MQNENQPRLLFLDIEWAPVKAYVWRAWDENINPEQVIEDGGLLCICLKFSDDPNPYFFSEWGEGKDYMLRRTRELILEADAIVTFNGDKYDLPKIQGELLRHNLGPLPPVTSIDVIKTVKKMGYFRSSLGFVGPFLGLGDKIKTGGFSLWKRVLEGDKAAQVEMRDYNIQDVILLEKLYERVRPFIKTHPHLGFATADSCPVCGSTHVQKRGATRTRCFVTQRLACQGCGHWFTGARRKL